MSWYGCANMHLSVSSHVTMNSYGPCYAIFMVKQYNTRIVVFLSLAFLSKPNTWTYACMNIFSFASINWHTNVRYLYICIYALLYTDRIRIVFHMLFIVSHSVIQSSLVVIHFACLCRYRYRCVDSLSKCIDDEPVSFFCNHFHHC